MNRIGEDSLVVVQDSFLLSLPPSFKKGKNKLLEERRY